MRVVNKTGSPCPQTVQSNKKDRLPNITCYVPSPPGPNSVSQIDVTLVSDSSAHRHTFGQLQQPPLRSHSPSFHSPHYNQITWLQAYTCLFKNPSYLSS